MKMSNLNDQVEIKVLLHMIDYAYHINPKGYQEIFSTKEKMDESYKYRIIWKISNFEEGEDNGCLISDLVNDNRNTDLESHATFC